MKRRKAFLDMRLHAVQRVGVLVGILKLETVRKRMASLSRAGRRLRVHRSRAAPPPPEAGASHG